MQVSITLYKQTFFSPANLPFDQITIGYRSKGEGTYETNLNQIYELESITLPMKESEAMNYDYCLIEGDSGKAYYCITAYKMTDENTAAFELVIDPFMSLGGITEIGYRAGRVKRYGNTVTNTPTEIKVADPFLQPTSGMVLNTVKMNFLEENTSTPTRSNKYEYILVSPYDLSSVPQAKENLIETAKYITDDKENTVTKYNGAGVKPAYTGTLCSIWTPTKTLSNNGGYMNKVVEGYKLYDYTVQAVRNYVYWLNIMNELSGNIYVYRIPKDFVYKVTNSDGFIKEMYTKSKEVGSFTGRYNGYSIPGYSYKELSAPDDRFPGIYFDIAQRCPSCVQGVVCLTSGEKIEHQYLESQGTCFFYMDPSPDGTMHYVFPRKQDNWSDGTIISDMAMWHIKGTAWERVPIRTAGIAGELNQLINNQLYNQYQDKSLQIANDAATYRAFMGNLSPSTQFSQQSYAQSQAAYDDIAASNAAALQHNMTAFNDPMILFPSYQHTQALPEVGVSAGAVGLDIAATLARNAIGVAEVMSSDPAISTVARNNYNRAMDRNKSMTALNIANATTPPTIIPSPSVGFEGYVGQSAIGYCIAPSDKDIKRFYDIIEMFGWATDVKANGVTPSYRGTRDGAYTVQGPFYDQGNPENSLHPAFFMQISGADAYVSGSAPLCLISEVNAALEVGIRFWGK